MQQDLNSSNPIQRLNAALTLAQMGDFSGLDVILDELASDNAEIRLEAAYDCARIGFSAAIEPLSHLVVDDPAWEVRNQAIFGLVGIGRPTVVPALIAALNDEDEDRREDARVALYRIIGDDILLLLADESPAAAVDPSEARSITEWWQTQSTHFDAECVYVEGELGSPEVFIRKLKSTDSELPDAILYALQDWTGEDFGQSPLPDVVANWEKWWNNNHANYKPGQRYFYGHPVP